MATSSSDNWNVFPEALAWKRYGRPETMFPKEYTSDPVRMIIGSANPGSCPGLHGILHGESRVCVLGQAASAGEVVELAGRVKPDVALLDLDLLRYCELKSLDLFTSLLSIESSIVMIDTLDKSQVVDAFRMGAHGILLKSSPARVFVESIHHVAAGRYWLDSESLAILVQTLRSLLMHEEEQIPARDYGLTPRELEIIAKIVSGQSNREVSREFSISERTVKHHLTNIFNKLGVSSRLGLAHFAVKHQLLSGRRSPDEISCTEPAMQRLTEAAHPFGTTMTFPVTVGTCPRE